MRPSAICCTMTLNDSIKYRVTVDEGPETYTIGPPGSIRCSNHMFRPNKEVADIQIVTKRIITVLKIA